MDAFKALLEKKKKAVLAETFGDRKFVKQSELEELRLKRLREEEQKEKEEKERRKRSRIEEEKKQLDRRESAAQDEELPKEEVIRRLRLLGQPITLFGEDDAARAARLKLAQEEFQLEDEHAGGQQANSLLEMQRAAKTQDDKDLAGLDKQKKDAKDAVAAQHNGQEDGAAEGGEEEEDETARLFRQAAEALKKKREEDALPVEERIARHFQKWCADWGEDLERRPEAVKKSGPGNQATVQYQQTMTFFKPLYKQLKQKVVHPEMVAGLYMIVQAIQQRNYLHAYDVYMRLAIGNNPWPIGVTSVGIHERSAREKISHVMNGAAHIMNDEATRKYLQAVKRLLTFVQRAYPTDPSRSIDFDGFRDAGRGAAGSGSDKRALLEAEQKGLIPCLEAPIHFHDKDGSVKVPPKWDNILRKSEVYKELSMGGQQTPPLTPPRSPMPGTKTPPKSPLKANP